MDELFALEKEIGEVNSVISMLYDQFEETAIPEDKIQYEKFEAPVEQPKKPVRQDGDEEEEVPPEEPPADEEGEEAKKPFNPAEFKWTITNGQPKNLPQLFREFKGNPLFDEKDAKRDYH